MKCNLCMECKFFPKYGSGKTKEDEPDCSYCQCNWGDRIVDMGFPICEDCTQESCRRSWAIRVSGLKGTCSGFVSKRALEARNSGMLNERVSIRLVVRVNG